MSEGAPDADELFTYSYVANAAGSNTPKLASIAPAPGGEPGSRLDFGFDAAGNQTAAAAVSAEGSPGRTSLLGYTEESRLSRLGTSDSATATDLLYDGRGMLRRAAQTTPGSTDFTEAEPVYSSEGLLLARRAQSQTTHGGGGDQELPPVTDLADETTYLFYFAGRPIAQLRRSASPPDPDRLLYLTTDHLGTPILATDELGETAWEGGLDPFGTPYAFPEATPPDDEPPCTGDDCATAASVTTAAASAETAGIFLRFPGQWDDPTFAASGLHGGLYYNVHRWYETDTGRYLRPDPLGLRAGLNLLSYAEGNPVRFSDPDGLSILICSRRAFVTRLSPRGIGNHAYFWDDRPGLPPGRRRFCGKGDSQHERGPGGDQCNVIPIRSFINVSAGYFLFRNPLRLPEGGLAHHATNAHRRLLPSDARQESAA